MDATKVESHSKGGRIVDVPRIEFKKKSLWYLEQSNSTSAILLGFDI